MHLDIVGARVTTGDQVVRRDEVGELIEVEHTAVRELRVARATSTFQFEQGCAFSMPW